MRTMFLSFFCIVVLASCHFSNQVEHHYDYVALDDYQHIPTQLENGTPLRLIAFSGGKPSDKEQILYYQFIGVNEVNGDTLRILTPYISVKSDADTSKTYMTPLQYDGSNQVVDAYFYNMDSNMKFLMQVDIIEKAGNIDTAALAKSMDNTDVDGKQFVVINKSMDLFQRSYKTAIGTLHFKEIPWQSN